MTIIKQPSQQYKNKIKMMQREIDVEFAQLRQILPNLPKQHSVDEYELLLGAIEYIRNLNELLKSQK